MSTTPPPYSPGPYGPPQQPHPYAGQQPYGQPPGPHPYPPQQQPYPHPYPAAQGGWGQPQPPGRRAGKPVWVGLATAVGVVFGLLVLKSVSEAGNRASGAGFPEAKYKIAVPKTLLGGQYQLDEDASQTKGKQLVDGTHDPKVRNPHPAIARYTSESPTQPGVIALSGMYGQFKDPATARKKMMAGAAEGEGAEVAVPVRDIRPLGADVTLSCQVLTSRRGGGTDVTLPLCAWADENTAASVGVVSAELAQQAPGSVDLNRIAETTLKVRAEIRQPLG